MPSYWNVSILYIHICTKITHCHLCTIIGFPGGFSRVFLGGGGGAWGVGGHCANAPAAHKTKVKHEKQLASHELHKSFWVQPAKFNVRINAQLASNCSLTPDLRFWGARSLSRAIAPLNSLPEERKYTPLIAVSHAPWSPTCWLLMSLNLSAVTIVTSQLSAAWHTLAACTFQTIAENRDCSQTFFCYILFTNNTTPRPLIHYIFSGRGSRWNCYIHWWPLTMTF